MKLTQFAAACCVAMLGVSVGTAATNTEGGGYEVIANAFGFGIDIPECADASKNIREIAIDELNIDIRETADSATGNRTYGPGQAHWGQAKLVCAVPPGSRSELQQWYEETRAGKGIRKNITVTLFKSDKSPGRSYSLLDCFPTHWESVQDEQNNEVVEWLYVRPLTGLIRDGASQSTKAEATTSDKFAQVRGFKVDISGSSGKDVDTAWESVSGGDMIIELTESSIGADMFRTNSPGHKTVGEITLRGHMTDQRKALCEWINDTVNGKPWKRMLTITELLKLQPGGGGAASGDTSSKSYNYHDCFPKRYQFPRLSVYKQSGPVEEVVTVKATRDPLPPSTIGLFELEGAPVASQGAVAIAIDDRALDRDMLACCNDFRAPVVTILLKPGTGGEMAEWLQKTLAGKTDRKSGSIILHDREHNERLGKIVLRDCIIEHYAPAGVTNTTGNVMEEVAIKPIRVELK